MDGEISLEDSSFAQATMNDSTPSQNSPLTDPPENNPRIIVTAIKRTLKGPCSQRQVRRSPEFAPHGELPVFGASLTLTLAN